MGYCPNERHHENDEARDRRAALSLQRRQVLALEDAAKSWKQIAVLMGANASEVGPPVKLGFEALPPVPEKTN